MPVKGSLERLIAVLCAVRVGITHACCMCLLTRFAVSLVRHRCSFRC